MNLPVDELRRYVQEYINSLEARMNERRLKELQEVAWMKRTLSDLERGMQLLNDGNVDLALDYDNVLLAIADGQDKAQANIVLRTRAGSNPYIV